MTDPIKIDQIVAAVNDAGNLLARLQQAPDPVLADALGERASEMLRIFKVVLENATKLGKAGGERERALKAIGEVVAVEGTLELARFFENVSLSLIEAQKELNAQSLEYVRAADPRIPPAFFAIPSVKAEMKMGFSQVSQRGVNVVVFTRSQQKQEYGESTVTFELVAAPPPPGALLTGSALLPVLKLIVTGAERGRILKGVWGRLTELRANGVVEPKLLDLLELPEKEEEATAPAGAPKDPRAYAQVLQYSTPEPGTSRYLVLWPGKAEKKDVVEKWSAFAFFHVIEKAGTLEFDNSIWDRPTADPAGIKALKFAWIPWKDSLAHEPADKLRARLVQAGDVLMNVLLFIVNWLEFVSARGTKAESHGA
jgi:hypothetical protein